LREGYLELTVPNDEINDTIFGHPEFKQYQQKLERVFEHWKEEHYGILKGINSETSPTDFILLLSEDLLAAYSNATLIDNYDIYQHLMDYWTDTMKDDFYMIIEDGWKATLEPVRTSTGKIKKGQFECELIPKQWVIDRYFPEEKAHIEELKQQQEEAAQMMEESEQEHAMEGGLLEEAMSDAGNVTKGNLTARMKEIRDDRDYHAEYTIMKHYKKCYDLERKAKKMVKEAEKKLHKQVFEKYPQLTEYDVKTLVVDDKWLPDIRKKIEDEVEAVSRSLSSRIKELAERYDRSVTEIDNEVELLEEKVNNHLEIMGI